MYLSDKKNGVKRDMADHEELEVLLETFTKQVEEIVSEVGNIDVCSSDLRFQPITEGLLRITYNLPRRSWN